MVDLAQDGIWTIDGSVEGLTTFVNPRMAEMLGYAQDEMIGRSVFSFMDSPDREIAKQKIASRKKVTPEERDFVFIKKDGSRIFASVSAAPILDEKGNYVGGVAIISDITKRRQMEEALREAEERYHSMFENSGTATFVIEEDMTISMANLECEKLTGYSREEIGGKKKWTEFVVPEDLERMKKYHHQRREKAGVAPTEYEFRFVDKLGNIKDVFIKIGLIPGTKKSIASLMDITARKRAEEEIRSFPRRLIAAIEEERKTIVQNLHDECGGDLTALRFGLDHLEISKLKESEKKKIEQVKEIIARLGEKLQKISSALRPAILDHLGLIPALEWYIRDLKGRIPSLQIDFQSTGFKKRLKPELEIVLYRLIQEGLTNVIKHAKAKRADILLAYTHPQVVLSIKDDGDGFEEGKDLTATVGKRRGIGLWSMRERVASVGGTIHIRSRKGKGTVIRAELPAGVREKDGKN
jgi:PAS domain S-box-containing protein